MLSYDVQFVNLLLAILQEECIGKSLKNPDILQVFRLQKI